VLLSWTTSVCMWLMWFSIWMSQLNPLIQPVLREHDEA
jgi:hypothetical protein